MTTRVEGNEVVFTFEVRVPLGEVTTTQASKRKPKTKAVVRAALRKALNDLARRI